MLSTTPGIENHMPRNRPYTFELAALAVNGGVGPDNARKTAVEKGISPETFDRAVQVLLKLLDGGEDSDDFVLREYILDGWLQGYLPVDVQAGDPMLTTWQLGQLAEAHYSRQP